MPDGSVALASEWWPVHDMLDALGVAFLGVGWLVVSVVVMPGLAWLQAWPGRRLLSSDGGTDLALRVVQLTATRAAALDAHAAELRRIERSLHDGSQNRLVAVNVLLGAARRALARDPSDAVLARAQDAAEQSLVELREVIRSILPPVLAECNLADAVTGLASACPVPCRVDADAPGRCAASVEATAYSSWPSRSPTSRSTALPGRPRWCSAAATTSCLWRSPTTGKEARTRAVAPGSPGSAAASRRTTGHSRWPAPPVALLR